MFMQKIIKYKRFIKYFLMAIILIIVCCCFLIKLMRPDGTDVSVKIGHLEIGTEALYSSSFDPSANNRFLVMHDVGPGYRAILQIQTHLNDGNIFDLHTERTETLSIEFEKSEIPTGAFDFSKNHTIRGFFSVVNNAYAKVRDGIGCGGEIQNGKLLVVKRDKYYIDIEFQLNPENMAKSIHRCDAINRSIKISLPAS